MLYYLGVISGGLPSLVFVIPLAITLAAAGIGLQVFVIKFLSMPILLKVFNEYRINHKIMVNLTYTETLTGWTPLRIVPYLSTSLKYPLLSVSNLEYSICSLAYSSFR